MNFELLVRGMTDLLVLEVLADMKTEVGSA